MIIIFWADEVVRSEAGIKQIVPVYDFSHENPSGKISEFIWVLPKIGENSQNGWLIMKNPVEIHDLGVILFVETPILLHKRSSCSSSSRPGHVSMFVFKKMSPCVGKKYHRWMV